MTLAEASDYLLKEHSIKRSASYLRVAAIRESLKAEKRGRDWFVKMKDLDVYRTEVLGKRGRPKKVNEA